MVAMYLYLMPQGQIADYKRSAFPTKSQTFASSLPFSVMIHRNQAWNRLFIELVGYDPWIIACARNKFERVEKILDVASWVSIGVFGPILLDKIVNKAYVNHLKKLFPLITKSGSPLSVPFEWLNATVSKQKLLSATPKQLASYGLEHIKQFAPKQLGRLTNKLILGKLMVIGLDLLLMASQGQLFFYLRNYLTQKWSKQKGFSGEFNYANKAYLDQQTADYDKNQKFRHHVSMAIGLGLAPLALPLLLWGVLKSKNTKGLMGSLKKLLPAFNYVDVVYMSKWVLLWQVLFNYNLPALMFSRDKHEFRENLTKMAAFDFFYFVGDDLISGLLAKRSEQRYGAALKGVRLVQQRKLGPIQWPVARSLHHIYEQVGKNTAHFAFQQARNNFWLGLLITALGLGVSTPLLNNWYTRKKVLAEQQQMNTEQNPNKQTSRPSSKEGKQSQLKQSVLPTPLLSPAINYWPVNVGMVWQNTPYPNLIQWPYYPSYRY